MKSVEEIAREIFDLVRKIGLEDAPDFLPCNEVATWETCKESVRRQERAIAELFTAERKKREDAEALLRRMVEVLKEFYGAWLLQSGRSGHLLQLATSLS